MLALLPRARRRLTRCAKLCARCRSPSLLALAPGPLHGYAVMKDVNRRLRRRAVIGPGTLYRTLKELRDLGWIGEADERPGESDDERRRYYQLTEEGREAAVAEADRLSELVEDARAVRLIGDGGARS